MNTITIIKKVNPASAQAKAMVKYLYEKMGFKKIPPLGKGVSDDAPYVLKRT